MNFQLTPEQQEVRALARDFAEREVAPVIHHFEEAQEFPHEILAKLAGTGLMGALVPEEYGGGGGGQASSAPPGGGGDPGGGPPRATTWGAHTPLAEPNTPLLSPPAEDAPP